MEVILKVKEVARILSMQKQGVRKLIRKGKLKGFRMRTSPKNISDWRILSADLQEYISKEYSDGTRKFWDKRCAGVNK